VSGDSASIGLGISEMDWLMPQPGRWGVAQLDVSLRAVAPAINFRG